MPSYSSLTPAQKIQYAKDVSMANNGVTQPNTTAINIVNLDKLITSTSVDINATKQLLGSLQLTSGASPYTYPVPFSSLPGEVQSKLKQFIPPGYTPPTTITGQELIDIEQGVLNSLQELKANPATLPKAGIGTVPAVQPAAIPATTLPTNTTPASLTVDIRMYRILDNTNYLIATQLPIPGYDILPLPLNGQFVTTGDRLEITSNASSGINVMISYTVGQAEQDDVDGSVVEIIE